MYYFQILVHALFKDSVMNVCLSFLLSIEDIAVKKLFELYIVTNLNIQRLEYY